MLGHIGLAFICPQGAMSSVHVCPGVRNCGEGEGGGGAKHSVGTGATLAAFPFLAKRCGLLRSSWAGVCLPCSSEPARPHAALLFRPPVIRLVQPVPLSDGFVHACISHVSPCRLASCAGPRLHSHLVPCSLVGSWLFVGGKERLNHLLVSSVHPLAGLLLSWRRKARFRP